MLDSIIYKLCECLCDNRVLPYVELEPGWNIFLFITELETGFGKADTTHTTYSNEYNRLLCIHCMYGFHVYALDTILPSL